MIQKHKIFLGDEPVSAQDDFHKIKIIKTIISQFSTCIFILHDLEIALSCCQRVIGIGKGKIIFDEAVSNITKEQLKQVYSHHQIAFNRNFT